MAFHPVSPGINPIHVWAGLRIELVWIYDGQIHPTNRQRQTDHTHGYWVWLLHQGTVEVRCGKNRLTARAGECMISPRGLMEQKFSEDASLLSIRFGCEWPTGDSLFQDRGGLVFKERYHPDFFEKARALSAWVKGCFSAVPDVQFVQQPVACVDYLSLQRHFIGWLEIFTTTLLTLGYEFTQIGTMDERVVRALRCLKESALDGGFPDELLQKETELGRSRLERVFFQALGVSTRSFWTRRKLESAKALLATTSIPVKELGFRLGFKQASHFSQWFHSHIGLTPAAYRDRERFHLD